MYIFFKYITYLISEFWVVPYTFYFSINNYEKTKYRYQQATATT